MIIVNINPEETYARVNGLWQYDYGQVLRIQGLSLPPAIEIHFSLQETGGETVTRVGVTKDGATDVVIPDFILEGAGSIEDYFAYAFIYPSDESSGQTEYRIEIGVKSRPKPEGYKGSGDDTMGAIMKAVNKIAAGKIDTPIPAKVGQVVAVKSVDYDGKPTEFEAVDPGGGIPDEKIAEAVDAYLTANPLEEKDPTVPDWAKSPKKPIYTAAEVGALPGSTKIPSSPGDVGADPAGTAESKVSAHNTSVDAHNDIRLLIKGLTSRLNALADSDDTTLDQMSEIVTYIKSNKSLIDAITTGKISTSDIVDNLTTNTANKPLSAAQGVVLKYMIDGIDIPSKTSDLTNDSGFISSPATAKVGQVICVKAVNENGKPTEFETTDKGDVIDVDAELKDYMKTIKPEMVSAIVEKGGSASETDAWGDFPEAVRAIPNGVSATETLPEQTNLIVAVLAAGGVGLTWKNTGASGYLIIKKTGNAPQNTSDGTAVYRGKWASDVVDSDVEEGTTYYYRIFPYNSANQYQAAEGESIKAITYKNRSGQLRISDISLGDKILFGQFGTAVQSWTVCDTQDKESGFVTVCLDGIATGSNKYFDASETNNPISTRASQGNNRWAYSNVRQWLNSDAESSSWFVAQHDYDVQPNYYNIKGWLADFTDYEKEILVPHKSKCILDTNDGGGSETVYDKMFLASSYAVGLEFAFPLEDEHEYELFDSNSARSFAANWWLRTVNNASGTPSTASGVRVVVSGGALSGNTAHGSNVAARPFCCLPTSAYIAWSDSDNAYVFADDSQRNS